MARVINPNAESFDDHGFAEEIKRLNVHSHPCFIYETAQDWKAFTAAFMSSGLERGEKCCYVHDTHTAEEVRDTLSQAGIDVAELERSQCLSIIHGSNIYLDSGIFDPDRMILFLIGEIQKATNEGYPALRLTGETGWVLQGMPGSNNILNYESRLNQEVFPEYPCLAVCQYDRLKFPPDFIKDVVLTHPTLIRDRHVYHNSFFIPTDVFLSSRHDEMESQFLFDNIEREDKRERELNDTVQKLQLIYEETTVVILVADESGHYIDGNQAALDFMECTREELLKTSIWDTMLPEFLASWRNQAAEVHTPKQMEAEYLIKGNIKTLLLSIVPFNLNGKPVLYGIGQDITQRKQMEVSLVESEEKFRQLYLSMNEGVALQEIVYDNFDKPLDYIFVDVNPAHESMTGISREKIVGMRASALYSPDPPACLDVYASVAETQKPQTFETYFAEEDKYFRISVFSPQKGRFATIVNEITARKRAEKALQESERKYKELAELLPELVFETDISGNIIFANKNAWDIFGVKENDIQKLNIYDFIVPEDKARVLSNIKRTIQQGHTGANEYTAVKVNGEKFPILVSSTMVRNARGEICGIRGILVDITERKRIEDERRRAAEKLEELYNKEHKQRQELQEEARARGMFIDVLAHELRTPLTPIMASTGILQDLIKSKSDELEKKLVGNIYTSVETLIFRLEELLDLARYSRGTFTLNRQKTDMSTFLAEVVARFNPYLLRENQHLVLEMADDLPKADVDPSRLEQVILNLLSNASKFSPQNTVITVKVAVTADGLLIEVKDNGIGITVEEQQRLFQPYHRVEQDRQKFPGIGLGLAVAKQIVEAHGGKIRLTSTPNQGSTFSVLIPLVSPPNN